MLSITKVPAKSVESLDDDHYLQYRRENDGTYVFDGDMRATPERYDRKAHPWEEADDIWADPEFPYPPSEFFSDSTTWLRACDTIENPVVFQKDIANLTVNRGRFETSKFLVVFVTTMERKELFQKVCYPFVTHYFMSLVNQVGSMIRENKPTFSLYKNSLTCV